jgi:DNA-binding transcriptional regulator GbsR (MarR family)
MCGRSVCEGFRIVLAWRKISPTLPDMETTPAAQKFILHWGEMGTRWGISRTVAQIHALLYISPQPLHAEDICKRLDLARSNVSTSLKELVGWGILRTVHVLGDRRDYFESVKDVMEMFRIILAERKRREVDPTLALLRECLEEATKRDEPETISRLKAMQELFELGSSVYEQVRRVPTPTLLKLAKAGDKILSLFGSDDK